MGIYLEGMVNTPVDPTYDDMISCYTCDNDCQGIILDVLRETPSWGKSCDEQLAIFDIFDSKNYTAVSYSRTNPYVRVPHLDMFTSQAKTLQAHLGKNGFEVIIKVNPHNKFHCFAVILRNDRPVNPLDMLDVFEALPVRGE